MINLPEYVPSPPVHGQRDDDDHDECETHQNGDQEAGVHPVEHNCRHELVIASRFEVLAVGRRPEVVESVLVGRPEGQVTDAACEAVAGWEVASKTII